MEQEFKLEVGQVFKREGEYFKIVRIEDDRVYYTTTDEGFTAGALSIGNSIGSFNLCISENGKNLIK